MTITEKISFLRNRMAEEKIDAYIITKLDPHLCEYAPLHFNSVLEISGFTGSAGSVVVTAKEAGLWTDGRYYLQAETELKDTGITLHKEMEIGVKGFIDFAIDETSDGGVIAFDGRTMSVEQVRVMQDKMQKGNKTLRTDLDLVGEQWSSRPCLPENPVFDHEVCYSGVSRADKFESLRAKMKEQKADAYVITSLDDIAWLFNLRGRDIDTLFIAFAVIETDLANLFINAVKVNDVRNVLESDGVTIRDYAEVYAYLENLESDKVILIDPDRTNYAMFDKIENRKVVERKPDLTTEMKAIKNEVELSNLEKCNILDGTAMVKFIKWIKENAETGTVTECGIADKLTEFRSVAKEYLCQSFDTIAGYMENGAIIHYHAQKENCKTLDNKGIVLVDSGANYLCGTTDITRTIALGEASDEIKSDFTLVLKGHINLARAIFVYGTFGMQLDTLARVHMWRSGIDYKTGTGHGLGYCLNVHEGPQNIGRRVNTTRLESGMIQTNEPGIYRNGKHGIRTENTILVHEHADTEFGKFMAFKTISYCPIDLDLVNVSMLTCEEKEWLNAYHATVYEKLSESLDASTKEWLKNQTRAI